MPSPKINAIRLNHSLEDLGRIGHTEQGMQRVAFSPFDVEGRSHTMELPSTLPTLKSAYPN